MSGNCFVKLCVSCSNDNSLRVKLKQGVQCDVKAKITSKKVRRISVKELSGIVRESRRWRVDLKVPRRSEQLLWNKRHTCVQYSWALNELLATLLAVNKLEQCFDLLSKYPSVVNIGTLNLSMRLASALLYEWNSKNDSTKCITSKLPNNPKRILHFAVSQLNYALKQGIVPSPLSISILAQICAHAQRLRPVLIAKSVFESKQQQLHENTIPPTLDVVAYGALVYAAGRCNRIDIMERFLREMGRHDIQPSAKLICGAVESYSRSGAPERGLAVWESAQNLYSIEPDSRLLAALSDACARASDAHRALHIFRRIQINPQQLLREPTLHALTLAAVRGSRFRFAMRLVRIACMNSFTIRYSLISSLLDCIRYTHGEGIGLRRRIILELFVLTTRGWNCSKIAFIKNSNGIEEDRGKKLSLEDRGIVQVVESLVHIGCVDYAIEVVSRLPRKNVDDLSLSSGIVVGALCKLGRESDGMVLARGTFQHIVQLEVENGGNECKRSLRLELFADSLIVNAEQSVDLIWKLIREQLEIVPSAKGYQAWICSRNDFESVMNEIEQMVRRGSPEITSVCWRHALRLSCEQDEQSKRQNGLQWVLKSMSSQSSLPCDEDQASLVLHAVLDSDFAVGRADETLDAIEIIQNKWPHGVYSVLSKDSALVESVLDTLRCSKSRNSQDSKDKAIDLLSSMECPTMLAFQMVLQLCARECDARAAVNITQTMRIRGLLPNSVVAYEHAIQNCLNTSKLSSALRIVANAFDLGEQQCIPSDIIVELIIACSRAEQAENAHDLLSLLLTRKIRYSQRSIEETRTWCDTITSDRLLSAFNATIYVNGITGNLERAFQLYERLIQLDSVDVDIITLSSLASACLRHRERSERSEKILVELTHRTKVLIQQEEEVSIEYQHDNTNRGMKKVETYKLKRKVERLRSLLSKEYDSNLFTN